MKWVEGSVVVGSISTSTPGLKSQLSSKNLRNFSLRKLRSFMNGSITSACTDTCAFACALNYYFLFCPGVSEDIVVNNKTVRFSLLNNPSHLEVSNLYSRLFGMINNLTTTVVA